MLDRTHDAIVNEWTANARAHDDENYAFLRSLKGRSSSEKVDQVASQLHQQVFQIIDCTRCANCCRTLRPNFDDDDIDRIAGYLGRTREQFIDTFLIWEEDEHCYRTKTAPCPLLGEDGRCTVYEVRPETCRGYPYTDQGDFAGHTTSRASAALVCPAAFAVIEGMKKQLGRRRPRR